MSYLIDGCGLIQITEDRRLINAAHFLFAEFDSLIVPNTRHVQEVLSKALTEYMIKKQAFQLYDAQVLMHLACLNIKFCQVVIDNIFQSTTILPRYVDIHVAQFCVTSDNAVQ